MGEGSTGISRRSFVRGAAGAWIAAETAMGQSRPSTEAHRPLRLAQIGMQGHYTEVVAGAGEIKDCQLVAVARSSSDERIESLQRFKAWTPETRVYDDYHKMLEEARPDIVAVFCPFAHNGRASIEAVRHGCNVFSEKPLAGTLEELAQLRRERDRMNVRVTAMLPMRVQAPFVAARRAVREGLIGEPLLISAQKSYQWGRDRPWYYKQRKDYGGSIPWVAIHAIDFIHSVTGLDYAGVTARQMTRVHKDYPECEDCGAILFDMSNGGQATLTFDFLRPMKAAGHGDDRLRVVGTKGIVEVRVTETPFCELISEDAPPQALQLDAPKMNLFVDFVESIRTGRPHALSPEDPFRATEVALKAREAADARKTVAL